MSKLIGVFGGTFDPPHQGHLILAEAARAQLGLDTVLWVLTRHSPHKLGRPISLVDTRLQMLQLALEDWPGFEISRVEIDRPPPYYAVDTLCLLQSAYPGARLVYLMGGDSLRDLPAWHEPKRLVACCYAIGVLHRAGDEALDLDDLDHQLPGLKGKIRWIQSPLIEISASMIRQRVQQNLPYQQFLPPAVADYIEKHQLYRS